MSNVKNKIAVIGEDRVISVFRALGFLVMPLGQQEKAKLKSIVEKLTSEDAKIIFVQEDFFSDLSILADYGQLPYPIILPLATHKETRNLIPKILKESSIKAAGTEYIEVK